MASVHFVYPGPPEQRVSAKVTAMQTLASVWSEVAGKFKPALDPGSVSLGLKEGSKPIKPVDLNTPWRLANIPAGSSLHITSCRPAAAAAAAAPAAPAQQPNVPTHQGTGMSTPTNAPAAAAESAPAPPPPFAGGFLQAAAAEFRDPAPVVAAAAAAAHSVPAEPPASAAPPQAGQDEARPQQCSPVTSAVQQEASAQPHSRVPAPQVSAPTVAGAPQPALPAAPPPQPHVQLPPGSEGLLIPDSAGLGRPAVLVTEAALRAAVEAATSPHPHHTSPGAGREASASGQGDEGGAEGMAVDEDDSFYDLTPEDFAALARAAEARRKEEAAGLKTKAMREAEERAKEESFSSVAVRVRFPDGIVLQAGFSGAEHLSALQELVSKVVVPGTKFHLFTTPPKQVLKDLDLSFYKAGLVPAANVHCGPVSGTAGGGSMLHPRLIPCVLTSLTPGHILPGQLRVGEPSGPHQEAGHGRGPAGPAAGSQQGASAGGSRAGARPAAGGDGEKKVPKWLKLK